MNSTAKTGTHQPLSGITIVDFSQLIAGPAATSLLVGLGADVIKVEPPSGDPMRNLSAAERDHGESSGSFQAYNAGKRSVVIDLKTASGVRSALALCARADVIVESFRPGVMTRLGLDFEALRSERPRLVTVSITAFGSRSPESGRGGVDIVLQAETGFMAATGTPDTGPLKAGAPIIDSATGYVAALAAVTGLLNVERTGVGAAVEVPMFDVGVHLQSQAFSEFALTGVPPVRCGNRAPYAAPAGVFRAADGELVVSAHLPRHWKLLCEALGLSRLVVDERFLAVEDRVRNREELEALLSAEFERRTVDEWVDDLTARGLTVGTVRSYADVMGSAQAQATGLFAPARTDGSSATLLARVPLRSSAWVAPQLPTTPRLGEHSVEIIDPAELIGVHHD
mgnify:CR=1 FL=1